METNMEQVWAARREMAALIRKGHPMLRENHRYFLTNAYVTLKTCGCALGAVASALSDTVDDAIDKWMYRLIPETHVEYIERIVPSAALPISDITGLDDLDITGYDEEDSAYLTEADTIARVVNTLHENYDVPRLAIADWLETGMLPEKYMNMEGA